jgi:hypothetical protein
LFRGALGVSLAAPAIIGSRAALAAASNFQDQAGTNGFLVSPVTLQSTELNALTSGSAIISSVGGSSGVYSQSNTSNAIFGSVFFSSGGAFTPTAGGFLAGWFLLSSDGGTTFETVTATPSTTVMALPRPPDFVIPFSAAAYASGNLAWASGRIVQLPFESFKVEIHNLSGVSLPATGNLVKVGPVGTQGT